MQFHCCHASPNKQPRFRFQEREETRKLRYVAQNSFLGPAALVHTHMRFCSAAKFYVAIVTEYIALTFATHTHAFPLNKGEKRGLKSQRPDGIEIWKGRAWKGLFDMKHPDPFPKHAENHSFSVPFFFSWSALLVGRNSHCRTIHSLLSLPFLFPVLFPSLLFFFSPTQGKQRKSYGRRML